MFLYTELSCKTFNWFYINHDTLELITPNLTEETENLSSLRMKINSFRNRQIISEYVAKIIIDGIV